VQDRDFRSVTGAVVANGTRTNGTAESTAPSADAKAGNGHDLLGSIAETSREGMIVTDSRGSILLFNPACEKLFGYRRDEVLGRSARC
jgi:PAS domain-containing protein